MAHLSLGVLGSLQIFIDDAPVTAFESDKVCALLVYLAVEAASSHRRDSLACLLWPDFPEQAARHNLRQALFSLRLAIGDHSAAPPYLFISRSAIQFNRASDFSLDLARFNLLCQACEEARSQNGGDCSVVVARLEEMVQLYRGDFLQHFFLEDSAEFEQWALIQRASLHQRVLDACSFLANYHELHRDFEAARRHAARQLELDPWREEAHCQLMRALALDGQRSAALTQYEACRRVLVEELGVEPSARTRQLVEQIRAGDLKTEAESPSAMPAAPIHNLPVSLTSFHGREQELAGLAQLIAKPECRCISLVGPGGIGKTRLALEAAQEHRAGFAHGVAFIALAPVASVESAIPAIASAIQLSFFGQNDPRVQLLHYLRDRQMLLILDNVEHLLVAAPPQANIAELILHILQAAPGVKLLVTSREVLNLQQEWVFEVQGLAFPDSEQTGELDQYAAIALFMQRARHAAPGYAYHEADLAGIGHICRLVEGMPLAVELAATWLRTLSPADIAREIQGGLDVLSASLHDLSERHRSMRVVFDHSWQKLSAREQQALSQLSVFRGGFGRQAAEQVAGASLPVLSTLVNRTLVRRAAARRYQLHVLIRQYSAAQLAADAQAQAAAQKRHYDYFLVLAEAADQALRGHDQPEWLRRLGQEQDNLRAALAWALDYDRRGDELALRLAGALRVFWRMRGHFHEGRGWLEKCLGQCPEKNSAARAAALAAQASMLYALGDVGAARLPAEESAAIYRELGDDRGLARVLVFIGSTLVWQGETRRAQAQLEEALALARAAGDRSLEAYALHVLGHLLSDRGGDPAGRAMLAECAAILEEVGDTGLLASTMVALGIACLGSGEYGPARARLERGLALAREVGHPLGVADALTNLGCVYRILGEYALAQSHLENSLQVYREHGCTIWETDVHCALAENALSQGDFSTARLCLQAASSHVATSENKWLQMLVCYFQALLAYYEKDLVTARTLLEETVAMARAGQYQPDLARSLVSLGRVRRASGDFLPASGLLREGLALFRALGHILGIAQALEELGAVSALQGDCGRAVMLFSTAHALREELGAPLPPVDRAAYDSVVAVCHAQLGEAAFVEAWTRAAGRPFQEVVEEGLE
jgi:predicted ATPase/DNA-binding SARP family transcriptional activator